MCCGLCCSQGWYRYGPLAVIWCLVYAWSIFFLCSYRFLLQSRSYLRVWRRLTTTMPAGCRKLCFADKSAAIPNSLDIFQNLAALPWSIEINSAIDLKAGCNWICGKSLPFFQFLFDMFWPLWVCSENERYIFLHRTVDAFGLVQVELGAWKPCLIDLGVHNCLSELEHSCCFHLFPIAKGSNQNESWSGIWKQSNLSCQNPIAAYNIPNWSKLHKDWIVKNTLKLALPTALSWWWWHAFWWNCSSFLAKMSIKA